MYIILKIHAQVELADLFLLFVSCLNDSFSHYVPLQIALVPMFVRAALGAAC